MAAMLNKDFDVDKVLGDISLMDKIKLITGLGWWHTVPLPKHGIPSIRMTDGPNGARGTLFFNGTPSSCFPCSTGIGSSFDVDLAYEVGQALGDECRAKGAHVLLGPTVNTQRSPLGGRAFESFAEDPHLNGTLAAAWINGLQSRGVAATIKHFCANDQEFERFSMDSVVSQRALREIYLKPFELVIKHSNPWALMTGYNRLNGIHCSEDPWLIGDLLRKEWGWKDGLVMSDWTGVYSTAESIKAGVDLEMPGMASMRGPSVTRSLQAEKLSPRDIDACVRSILGLLKRALASGIPFDAPEKSLDTPEIRATLRKAAAAATVLLKNERGLLPIRTTDLKGKTVAVLGPNVRVAQYSGGGSARLLSTYLVSPLEGITAAVEEAQATLKFVEGATTHRFVPLAHEYLTLPDGSGTRAALMEFWNAPPSEDYLSTKVDVNFSLPAPVWSCHASVSENILMDGVDLSVSRVCWYRYSAIFTPTEDNLWEFGLAVGGRGSLFIDGECVIDMTRSFSSGKEFSGLGKDQKAVVHGMRKGKQYRLEIRVLNEEFMALGMGAFSQGGLRLGATPYVEIEQGIADATKLAREADVAILVVGLNQDFESEGFDRPDMELPGHTNRLVSAILEAQPNTIVVTQSGAPVAMPWADQADTILQAFYGGNELGNGLADVLFGKVNPSGKLALTFPRQLEDNPIHPSYGALPQEHGKMVYGEGIFVGYRSYEARQVAPLFAFGHGLSYTSFNYSDLTASTISATGEFTAAVTVTNAGSLPGREVALVFVSDTVSSLPRPARELKGFKKTRELGPGEKETLEIKLDRQALAFWEDRRGTWLAESGEFVIHVGGLDTRVVLEKELTWIGL